MAKKKKILLLSDDLRMTSGIATVSKEFVFGTMDKFHWVQLGAAVKHPEQGKEIDLGSICSGGSYAKLISRFRGIDVPVTGISFGVDRMLSLIHI